MAKSLEFRDGKKSKGEEEMVTLVKGLLKEDGEKPYVYLGTKSTPDSSLSNGSHSSHFLHSIPEPPLFLPLPQGRGTDLSE